MSLRDQYLSHREAAAGRRGDLANNAAKLHASRSALRVSLVMAVAWVLTNTASAQAPEATKIVLLGTAGGPAAHRNRAQPANAVVVGDDIYIVDAGDGIVRQMALGGYVLRNIRGVFITHHHSDHVAGYGPLLLRAWTRGRRDTITTWGPAPLEQMTADYLRHMSWDIDNRRATLGSPPIEPVIDANDLVDPGVIYEDENVKVTAFRVEHGAGTPAWGYRFDTADLSVVFSGDTRPTDAVIEAARGVDFLVHEVISLDAVEAMLAPMRGDKTAARRHLIENHTTTAQVGEIATKAGVRTLVLTHFGGSDYADFDQPEIWEAKVRETWSGELIVGSDLMVISVEPE